MDLIPIIKELLHTGGSVVVPGLGKFYTQYRPASIDKANHLLIPPGHILHFDPKTAADDGKLSRHLRRKYTLDEAAAKEAVSQYVSSVRKTLAENGRVVIGDLGSLETGEEEIRFSPMEKDQSLDSVLPSIHIPVTEEKEVLPPVNRESEMHPPVRSHAGKKNEKRSIMWLPVTLVILIAGLAAVLYFTGTFRSMRAEFGRSATGDSSSPENENRMVFGRPPAGLDSAQEVLSQQLDERTAKENALAYRETGEGADGGQPANLESAEAVMPPIAEKPAGETGSVVTGSYHIIAGSFLVSNNAEKQKTQLEQQGYHPAVLRPADPYYMVSLASYASLGEARAALEQFSRQLDIQLWVKKVE